MPLLELDEERDIIGLPSVSADKIWIAEAKDGYLVHIKHDIFFI